MRHGSFVLAAMAAAVFGGVTAAKADSVIQYSTTGSSPTAYSYAAGSLVVSEPVNITIFSANTYGSPSPTSTTGTLSVTLSGVPGSAGVLFGFFYGESITDLDFSLTAATPVGGLTNILSGHSDTGNMSGTTAGISITAQNPTDNVTFTSDFIDVSDLGQLSLQMNSGATSALSITSNTLDDFTAYPNLRTSRQNRYFRRRFSAIAASQ